MPSPADLDAIARADVLIENGVGLEEWLQDTIRSAGFDGTVRLWDPSSEGASDVLVGAGRNPLRAVAFRPDGRTLASGGDDGTEDQGFDQEAGSRP